MSLSSPASTIDLAPEADSTASPAPGETPAVEATATPSPAPTPDTEIVSGADTVRADIAERSETVGGIVNRLDTFAFEVGDWRISAFDVLFTVGAVLLVLAFAWGATRLVRSALRRLQAAARRDVWSSRRGLP